MIFYVFYAILQFVRISSENVIYTLRDIVFSVLFSCRCRNGVYTKFTHNLRF